MSRYKGGIIRSTPITTSRFGVNSGMFTLGQQLQAKQGGAWPSDYDAIIQFTDSGTFDVPKDVTELSDYLIVGGGGAGGTVKNAHAGGGGAGGFVLGSGLSVTPEGTLTITVGAGGANSPFSSGLAADGEGGESGSDSSISTHPISGKGGGGGALGSSPNNAKPGGSGGGGGQGPAAEAMAGAASNQPSPGVGNAGGDGRNNAGGGGGGAGAPGGDAAASPGSAGNGGNGLPAAPLSPLTFAGGGGGGRGDSATRGVGGSGGGGDGGDFPHDTAGHNGTVNTGGGGGGASAGPGVIALGGDGGSGVVIIKYKNKISNRLFKFTGSGVWKNSFKAKTIDYLIQAGGGAGGSNYGGGGGAGGLRLGSGLAVEDGVEYTISVGGGGTVEPASPSAGNNGFGSFIQGGSLSHIGANGGGGGGSYNGNSEHNSRSGGCGGGSGFEHPVSGAGSFGPRSKSLVLNSANGHSGSVTSENVFRGSSIQGSDGGEGKHAPAVWAGGGGGGGTFQIGQDAKQNHPGINRGGHGGNGITSTIDGNSTAYGGGGGGSVSTSPQSGGNELGGSGGGGTGAAAPSTGTAGTANTGGGGGAGGDGTAAGAGGSGIVILKITG